MDDLISRQAAIRFIRDKVSLSLFMKRSVDKADKACMELCEMLDKDLPSAERHGRWIKKYRGNYLCSVCGAWYRTTDDYGNIIDGEMTANYCESCGAKMDEVEE